MIWNLESMGMYVEKNGRYIQFKNLHISRGGVAFLNKDDDIVCIIENTPSLLKEISDKVSQEYISYSTSALSKYTSII